MKNTFLFILFLLFLYSCNKTQSQYGDYEIKEGYIQHEVVYANKRIMFVLPECYSDTYIPPDIMLDRWPGTDKKRIFYSTKNKYNSFAFTVGEYDYNEHPIDSAINKAIQRSIYLDPPMITFFEKVHDKTGHIFHIGKASCIDFLESESHIPKEDQNAVFSVFTYATYFGKKCYLCELETREPIKDFSYEEKKYIIESVRIEEIKE